MDKIGHYSTEEILPSRLGTIDIGIAGKQKHHIVALIELDVTESRQMIREKKRQHENISFTSWLIKCISQVTVDFKEIHGVRKGKRKIVVFEDIDISIVIERTVEGKKVPLPYVIRKTNEKSISDIYDEIKKAQNQIIEGKEDYVLGERKKKLLIKIYYAMPGFVRKRVWQLITKSPFMTKINMGTVIVTSIGMMGRINGWVIPTSVHPLCFATGSIVKKPGVVNGKIEIREYIYITALVDHDVIDGAPAARALSKLTKLVERGYGLN